MENLGGWMRELGDMKKLTNSFIAPNPKPHFVIHKLQIILRSKKFWASYLSDFPCQHSQSVECGYGQWFE
jgi:hypothetical protein